MLTMNLAVQIMALTSMACAIVTPDQLYKMVDHVVEFYANDSCLVVICSGGYVTRNHVPTVYVAPYVHDEMQDQNASMTHEESYKMVVLAPVFEMGCTMFLIQTENPGRQVRLIEKTFVHVNQRTQRRFIFIPTITGLDRASIGTQDEVLDSESFDYRSVLREKSVQYIPDIIFAVPNDHDDVVVLLTHRFSGSAELCRQEMLLDTYDVVKERFELQANLFPDKVKDLEGKVLKVALFHYPPYSVIIGNDVPNIRVDGTEWRFVVEFAKLHNSSLEEVVDNEGSWGHIYENLTGEGVTGNLVEDKADIGMSNRRITNNHYVPMTQCHQVSNPADVFPAALYTWYYESLFLDLTAPYYRTGVTCLVPGPNQFPQWKSPILPFSPTLWMSFIGMMVISVIFTRVVNRTESLVRSGDHSRKEQRFCAESVRMSFVEAALTVAGITLLQGLRREANGPSWAVLSITLLIVSLLIATAYGSSLVSAITVPRYEAPIDTASDLATSGIPWGAPHQAWIFSILNADEPEMRTLVKNFRKQSQAELARHSAENDNWAFSVERLQGGHYSIQDYIGRKSAEKMHLMKGDIYWEYCVSMLRKSSPFTKWYSYRILEIQASGIPLYWETDVSQRYLDARTQLAVDEENLPGHQAPVRMTARQIQGTFYILLIGLVLSGLVFLGELYTSWKETLRKH